MCGICVRCWMRVAKANTLADACILRNTQRVSQYYSKVSKRVKLCTVLQSSIKENHTLVNKYNIHLRPRYIRKYTINIINIHS